MLVYWKLPTCLVPGMAECLSQPCSVCNDEEESYLVVNDTADYFSISHINIEQFKLNIGHDDGHRDSFWISCTRKENPFPPT